ncbi:MAG: YdcH family protein [Burkholderiales bacterium]|nr:YdcH family protein [Burkholderiales bacterium]
MHIDHHPLTADFPEHKEAIQALKQNNAHFSKLFDEYEETEKAVNRAENGVDNLGDAALEALKKARLSLKDQLFQFIQAEAKA